MKKGMIIAIIVGLVVILGIALISANNNLVAMEAEVDAAFEHREGLRCPRAGGN